MVTLSDTHSARPAFPVMDLVKVAAAGSSDCRVSLQLLMDESNSISHYHYERQARATAKALQDPEVIAMIERIGGIAVMAQMVDINTRRIVQWHVIENAADAKVFADTLMASLGNKGYDATALGAVIHQAMKEFPSSPCRYGRKVIDISSDGGSNLPNMRSARDTAFANDVTINALAVMPVIDYSSHPDERSKPRPPDPTLEDIRKTLEANLVTPNGFAMATDWDSYADAIKQKLLMELLVSAPGKQEKQASITGRQL